MEVANLVIDEPINVVLETIGFSYLRIVNVISQVCKDRDIDVDIFLKNKKDEFFLFLLEQSKIYTRDDLVKKYRITKEEIRKLMNSYNEEHEDKVLIDQGHICIGKYEIIDISLIIGLKKLGYSLEKIAKMNGYSVKGVSKALKQYCEKNGLNYSDFLFYRAIEIDDEEIYILKLSGKSFIEIANKLNCTAVVAAERLKKYCDKNGLDYNSLLIFNIRDDILAEDLYTLKRQGKTFEELALMYGCSPKLISDKLKKYCEERDLDYYKLLFDKKVGYNYNQARIIHQLREEGVSLRRLGEMYNCSYETIRKIDSEYLKQRELVCRLVNVLNKRVADEKKVYVKKI